jgi:hypothetical protein
MHGCTTVQLINAKLLIAYLEIVKVVGVVCIDCNATFVNAFLCWQTLGGLS